MPSQLKRNITIVAAGAALAATGYGIAKVNADGVPTSQPLWYSGTVADESGVPLDSNYSASVRLYTTAVRMDGDVPVCAVGPADVSFVKGRFRIEVSDCADAIKANADLYVELTVDANPSDNDPGKPFARSKIGAVPYALEAQHAVSASNGAVTGAVVAFDLDACPAGWTELVAARGRTIVGVNPSAGNGLSNRARGDVYGAETTVLGAANLPAHAHSGQTSTGTEAEPGSTNASRDYNSRGCGQAGVGYQYRIDQNCWGGSVFGHTHTFTTDSGPGTSQPINLVQPSLALLYCRKD